MLLRLPHPSKWTDFESLCHMLWKEIWQDPNAQKNGRQGQAQHGVDIFGVPLYQEEYEGVQCKDKDQNLGTKLTLQELKSECSKAIDFKPVLTRFTLATTCPSDVILQRDARDMNSNGSYPFKVNIWFWNEIEAEIITRANLMEAFYKGFPIETDSSIKIAVTNSKDQFRAFFNRPNLWDAASDKLRIALKKISYELCDNAYRHGGADTVTISFDGNVFKIQYNGKVFNPFNELPKYKATSLGRYLGAHEFKHFLNKFRNNIKTNYSSEGEFNNNIEIVISMDDINSCDSQEITANLSNIWGRESSKRYAKSLIVREGIKELTLNFDDEADATSAAAVIETMRDRVHSDVNVNVLVGEDNSLLDLGFGTKGVTIKKRK